MARTSSDTIADPSLRPSVTPPLARRSSAPYTSVQERGPAQPLGRRSDGPDAHHEHVEVPEVPRCPCEVRRAARRGLRLHVDEIARRLRRELRRAVEIDLLHGRTSGDRNPASVRRIVPSRAFAARSVNSCSNVRPASSTWRHPTMRSGYDSYPTKSSTWRVEPRHFL